MNCEVFERFSVCKFCHLCLKIGKAGSMLCVSCKKKAEIKGSGDLRMILIWCLLLKVDVSSEGRQHLCKLWASNRLLAKLAGGVLELQPGSSAFWGVLWSSYEQIWVLGSNADIREKESFALSELGDPGRNNQSVWMLVNLPFHILLAGQTHASWLYFWFRNGLLWKTLILSILHNALGGWSS